MTPNEILKHINSFAERNPFGTNPDGTIKWENSFVHSISRVTVDGKEVFRR